MNLWYPRKRHNEACKGRGGLFGCRCGDPGTIAMVGMAILGGFAVSEEISALSGSKKSSPEMPALPSLTDSKQTALDEQNRQRKIALASGGQTNLTGGGGMLLGSDVHSISLVGAG